MPEQTRTASPDFEKSFRRRPRRPPRDKKMSSWTKNSRPRSGDSLPVTQTWTNKPTPIMQPSTKMTRRGFLKGTAAIAGGIGFPAIVPGSILGRNGTIAPGDRINLGFIGLGRKGFRWENAALVKSYIRFSECRIRALCDVHRGRAEDAKAFVDDYYENHDAEIYGDFRELLQREDIDAVVVATPHHWHACMTILACEHGKDVYCEKPLSNSIRQGRAMVEAARRYGRIVQTGSQARSSQKYAYACRLIQTGKIGEIKKVVVGCGSPPVRCNLPAQPVPEGLDWDLWVGPGQWHPYHPDLYEGSGHYLNFGGGTITDWGHHFFDLAQWGLGMDHTGPTAIMPPGTEGRELLTFQYGNGVEMELNMDPATHLRRSQGTLFLGTEGRIDTMAWDDYAEFEPRRLGAHFHAMARVNRAQGLVDAHFLDFLDCMRTRRRPNADVEIGCRSVNIAHLANIALWINRPLAWNPEREVFERDPEANRFLDLALRPPWRL